MPLYIMKMKLIEKIFVLATQLQFKEQGDVIPQVVSVDKTKRDKKSSKYIFPEKCLCGAKTKKEISTSTNKEDAVRRCSKEDMIVVYSKRKIKTYSF